MNHSIRPSLKCRILTFICIILSFNFVFSQITDVTINNGEAVIVACDGETVDIVSELTGPPVGQLSYVWEIEAIGGAWSPVDCNLSEYSGCDSETLVIVANMLLNNTAYRLIVTDDDNGILDIHTSNFVTLTVTPNPIANINLPDPTCEGEPITFEADDAGPGAIYTWTFGMDATPSSGSGMSPPDVTYSSAGTKDIILVVDLDGCQSSTESQLEIFDFPVIDDVIPTDPTTCGGSDGIIEISASGGNGTFEYTINDGVNWAIMETFPNLSLGDYVIKVRNANGLCEVSGGTITLSDPDAPIADFDVPASVCQGEFVDFLADDAGAGASYTWDFGLDATPSTGSGINPTDVTYSSGGTKDITLEVDLNGCQNSVVKQLEIYPLPEIEDVIANSPSTCGGSNGSIEIDVLGGTGTFEYSIDDGNTWSGMNTFPNLSAGGYIIKVRNDNGFCEVSGGSVSLSDPDAPTADFEVPASVCEGESVEFVAEDVGAGATYNWDFGMDAMPPTGSGINPLDVTYSSGGVKNIILVVELDGCESSVPEAYTVFEKPEVELELVEDEACDNGPSVILLGGSPSGGTYSYNGNAITEFDVANEGVGTYEIIYTFEDANGCENTASDEIEVFALPNVSLNLGIDAACEDESSIALSGGSPSNGTYSYNGNAITIFNVANAGVGVYEIIYTYEDNNGCENTASDEIEVFALPNVSLNLGIDEACENGPSITLSGGMPTLPEGTYSYSGNAITEFNVANAGVGTHEIIYTYGDNNGCENTASDEIEVFELPNVNLNLGTDEACENENAVMLSGGTPTGSGGSYSYNGNNITVFNASNANIGDNEIEYTFVDNNGCEDTSTDDIEVYAEPEVSVTPADPSSCNGSDGSIVISASGGTGSFDYSIDDGATWSSNATQSGLSAGNYIIKVRNDNGFCEVSGGTVSLNDPNPPNASFTIPSSVCAGVSVQFQAANAGTGATYSWDFGAGANPATGSVLNPPAVTYSSGGNKDIELIVTLAGCVASQSISYTVFDLPVVSLTLDDDEECKANTSLILSGGESDGVGVYSGTGVNSSTGVFNASAVPVGTYEITYQYTDSNNCSSSAADDITVYSNPVVEVEANASSALQVNLCEFDNLNLTSSTSAGTPVYDYSWTGPMQYTSMMENPILASVEPNQTGTYSLLVTDTKGCTGTESVFVNIFNAPTASFVEDNTTICEGSTASIEISGTNAAQVSYSSGGTTNTLMLDPGGDGLITTLALMSSVTFNLLEIVETTTGLGCTNSLSDTYVVIVNATPSVNAINSITECNGLAIPAISFSGSVGATFDWSNNNTGAGLGANGTGNIPSFIATNGSFSTPLNATVSVTPFYENNNVSCPGSTEAFSITVNPSPFANLAFSESTGNIVNDGTICAGDPILIEASDGVNYDFIIDNTSVQNSNSNTYSSSTLPAGEHDIEVQVTNQYSCISSVSNNITVNPLPVPLITVTEPSSSNSLNAICLNDMIGFTASCNNNCESFYWNSSTTSQTTYDPGNLALGDHVFNLDVVDDNNCMNNTSTTVTVYPLPDVTFTTALPPGQSEIFQGVQVEFTAGSGPNYIDYDWDFGDCENIVSNDMDVVLLTFDCDGTQDVSLQITDDNDCSDSYEEQVYVFNGSLDIIITNPADGDFVCQDVALQSVVQEISTIDLNYLWELIAGPLGVTIDDIIVIAGGETTLDPQFNFNVSGSYTLQLTASENIVNGDVVSDIVTFEVVEPPSALSSLTLAPENAIVCQGESVNLGVNIIDDMFPDYQFQIGTSLPGGGQSSSLEVVNNSTTIEALTSTVGTYEYTITEITDANGCATGNLSNSISYQVVAPPQIVGNQTIDCPNITEFTVSFEIASGTTPYTIIDIDGNETIISTTTFTSGLLSLNSTGTPWEFEVVDANGCSAGSISGTTTETNCASSCLIFGPATSLTIDEEVICAGSDMTATVMFTETIGVTQGYQFLLQDLSSTVIASSAVLSGNCSGGCMYTFTNIAPGNYTVIVQGGEVVSGEIANLGPCQITLSPSQSLEAFLYPDITAIEVDTSCAGVSTSMVTLTTTGGVGSYELSIDNIAYPIGFSGTFQFPTPSEDSVFPINSFTFNIPGLECTTFGTNLTIGSDISIPVFELPIIDSVEITDAGTDGINEVDELITFTAYVTGEGPFEYEWVFGTTANNSITFFNVLETSFSSGGFNDLTLTVTDDNGCVSIPDDTLFVIEQQNCIALLTPDKDTICASDSILLIGSGFFPNPGDETTFAWEIDGTVGNEESSFLNYVPDATTGGVVEIKFSYTIVNANSTEVCSADTVITVYVLETPGIQSFADNGDACLNQQVSYLANMGIAADQYTWAVAGSGLDTDYPFVNVRWEESGVYTLDLLAANDNGCTDMASLTVNVDENNIAPPYYDLFQIERDGELLVGYPDSTRCYEWHGANDPDDFVTNINTDNTLLDIPRTDQYYVFALDELDAPRMVWVDVYGINANCLGDDCHTRVFYEINGAIPTIIIPRSNNAGPEQKDLAIQVYPNPNTGAFSLEIAGGSLGDLYKIQIVDIYGRLSIERELNQDNAGAFISQISIPTKGVYFLRIVDSNQTQYVKKIVVH